MQRAVSLHMDDIHIRLGGCPVLNRITLTVNPGEMTCILGSSGCGKTTLLRAVAGFVVPEQGRIMIGDREVAGPEIFIPPEQRNIGMIFQDFGLFPHLSVLDNVRFGLKNRSKFLSEAREIINWLDLDHVVDAFPHTLSGGQQQRVAVARALASQPQALLLDEPFSSLDVLSRRRVRDRVLHLLKEKRITSILVTHDPEEALFMADHIAVLRSGYIEQSAIPEDLVLRSASPEIASMFGETSIISAHICNGKLVTPLGTLEAKGLDEGGLVMIAVRSSSLQLLPHNSSGNQGAIAKIIASRMLGDGRLLHLEIGDLHLHCRVSLNHILPEGEWVRIKLDPDQALIFPANQINRFCNR